MKRKWIGIMCLGVSLFSLNLYGQDLKVDLPTFTVDEAIKRGLTDNILLNKVKNQAELAALISENATESRDAIYRGGNDLSSANDSLSEGRNKLYTSMDQLDSAQVAIDNGLAPPGGIPLKHPQTGQLIGTIPQGANIQSYLDASGLSKYMSASQIIQVVQNTINKSKEQLNQGLKSLDESTQAYIEGKSKYDLAVQFAMTNVANKLSTSTISSLDPNALGDLLVEMSSAQDRVTSYSITIYKNQLAMKIENSFYEAVKHAKLLASKGKALERGKLQYEYADYAYKIGAKSKDDMLFAKAYYTGAAVAYDVEEKEYEQAMIELKKNMNLPLEKDIQLVDALEATSTVAEKFDINKGIESGKAARLDEKMAKTQEEVYSALLDAVKRSSYSTSDNAYKEATLLLKKAEIERANVTLESEATIRHSYQNLVTAEKVKEQVQELAKDANENLEIAKLKYEVGFGADNALLKNLNLTDLSGTMVEVLAAEENVANMEAKLIEADHMATLAKTKYRNDIGILPYQ